MRMNFAVGMNADERMDEIGAHALAAEDSGFDFITYVDQPYMSRDVFASMTIAAMNTRRIRIGPGVIDMTTHAPLAVAGGTASVDELSGGRVIVGIGAGGAFGETMKPRTVKELHGCVEFIQSFTRGDEVEAYGQQIRCEFHKRQLPVYIGANGPKMLEMAGAVADGVMLSSAFGVHPAMLKWRLAQIERGALKAGRDPGEIDVWARAMIYVADSIEEALPEVAGYVMNSARSTIRILGRGDPEQVQIIRDMEKEAPGLIDECQRVSDAWTPEWNEHRDAPAAKLITRLTTNLYHMVGKPEDICEKIHNVGQLGIKTIATVTYPLSDKKGMMREIGDKVMTHFRS
jgi:5,10-methylenetetrahydromethanopterin reductase